VALGSIIEAESGRADGLSVGGLAVKKVSSGPEAFTDSMLEKSRGPEE
jgi:hypothetical protein